MARRVAAGSGTLVLDSEGLSKAAANDVRVGAFLKIALHEQGHVIVSAVTLAEVLRGGRRDAAIHRVLGKIRVEPVDAGIGRMAGELIGSAGMRGGAAVDALVAATALQQRGRVVLLTSDPDDLARLTDGRGDVTVVHV